MEKKSTLPVLRATVRLSQDQRLIVDEYFIRTAVLWNLLHHHLKDEAELYLNCPVSDQADEQFTQAGLSLYDNLLKARESFEKSGFDNTWENFMDRILELPNNLIYNRVMDLLSAYRLAKEDADSGKPSPSGPPGRKTANSSQSVRFSFEDFELKGGKVSINSIFPLEIEVPDFSSLTLGNPWYLAISRRKINEADIRKYGPPDEDNQPYVISLRSVN